MDSTTFGERIIYIITTLLAAAGISTVVPLTQEQPSEDQTIESNTVQQESNEVEAKDEPMPESKQMNSGTYTLDGGVVIEITPTPDNGKLSGPLSIKGTVPGSSTNTRFTIRVIDPAGNAIVNSSVSASGSGGNAPANFNTTLNFSTSSGGTGSLQIKSDSGGEITIPLEF